MLTRTLITKSKVILSESEKKTFIHLEQSFSQDETQKKNFTERSGKNGHLNQTASHDPKTVRHHHTQ